MSPFCPTDRLALVNREDLELISPNRPGAIRAGLGRPAPTTLYGGAPKVFAARQRPSWNSQVVCGFLWGKRRKWAIKI